MSGLPDLKKPAGKLVSAPPDPKKPAGISVSGHPDRIFPAGISTSAIPHRKKQAAKPVSEKGLLIPIYDSGESSSIVGRARTQGFARHLCHRCWLGPHGVQPRRTGACAPYKNSPRQTPCQILSFMNSVIVSRRSLHRHTGTWHASGCPQPRHRSALRNRRIQPPKPAVAGRRSGARSRPVQVAPFAVRRSPGWRVTAAKPFNSLTARGTDASQSRTYN